MISQDEVFTLTISVFFAFYFWGGFVRQCVVRPFRYSVSARAVLLAGLALALGLLGYVLVEWSSHDVRNSAVYIFFYFVIGVTWLGLCRTFLDGLDLRARDDVLERGNPAAAWACGGALTGFMACFAGGNIGDGPGWWVVLYSAGLATGAAGAAWIVLDMTTRLADSITIERDIAAGLRAGGFWIGAGLILGRAVAGNWVSVGATNRDFAAEAWPVLPLLAVALALELIMRPGAILGRVPVAVRGALPGAVYAGAGVISLLHFGAP